MCNSQAEDSGENLPVSQGKPVGIRISNLHGVVEVLMQLVSSHCLLLFFMFFYQRWETLFAPGLCP